VEPARHLYVHVPFCAHRCGYCAFVTVTGHEADHSWYVEALLAEHVRAVAEGRLAERPDTIYLGGGTPTLLGAELLARLLDGLGPSAETSVECNPETVTDDLATALAARAVRVSLGAQSFHGHLLAVLERRAAPETVRRAATDLRRAGVGNLSLDLLFGVPGQSESDLAGDLAEAIALGPDHVSAYEIEAKPGTRFTVHHAAELAEQAELLETHYELVVTALEAAGYGWYETANFARPGRRSLHNLAYWEGRDYVGIGIGAVSTVGLERRTNEPRLAAYRTALSSGRPAPHRIEALTPGIRAVERLMLGLRLGDGVAREAVSAALDTQQEARLRTLGILGSETDRLVLTRRGRFVADDAAALLADLESDER
jgi:oxygen-independent coproporphyrinogen-3 oxidase